MASMYAHLKSTIPEEPTERDLLVQSYLSEYEVHAIADLTRIYNTCDTIASELATRVKQNNARKAALEVLIRKSLNDIQGDAITMDGFTWSPKFEPYPVCEDPSKIVDYFREHDMEDQLVLTNTELASRLKSFVKEEALNNDLVISTETAIDHVSGEEKEITVVRSRIPGVKVYLKGGLSRTKAKGAKS